jgi:hypothetical protein
LEYVRTLSREDLSRMAGSDLDRDTLRSFRNADLVIEAMDGTDTKYVALEISFTADRRELDRAIRNAELITRSTGKMAQAAVASVRNDREAGEVLDPGLCTGTRLRIEHQGQSATSLVEAGPSLQETQDLVVASTSRPLSVYLRGQS